jgi:hypothetical protein
MRARSFLALGRGQFDCGKVAGWKNGRGGRIFGDGLAECFARKGRSMALILIKIAILAVLAILTFGVFPDRLKGGIIAIATCVAAAFVLHFVAP